MVSHPPFTPRQRPVGVSIEATSGSTAVSALTAGLPPLPGTYASCRAANRELRRLTEGLAGTIRLLRPLRGPEHHTERPAGLSGVAVSEQGPHHRQHLGVPVRADLFLRQ